jgi:hypothetical protein
MNPFLKYPVPVDLPPRPQRVYARLDDIEFDEKKRRARVRLGATDADWFDAYGPRIASHHREQRAAELNRLPVFILEGDLAGPGSTFPDEILYAYEQLWIQLTIGPGAEFSLFRNLYGEAERINITSFSAIDEQKATQLSETHSLDDWMASDDELESKITFNHKLRDIAVYDVGQGSAVGLTDGGGKPLLYFDFGGGVTSHLATRPHSPPYFCLCAQPLMLLSHWDTDHWSSAPLQPASLSLDWVAPYQTLTPPQIAFAATIAAGHLFVSKAAPGTVFSYGNAEYVRASGTSRNNGGFWLLVNPPQTGEPFVFPADADYNYLGTKLPGIANGISATHHGASWASSVTPPGAGGSSRQRVVFSYGSPNSYKHPTTRSIGDHTTAGFSRLDTTTRSGGLSGNTTGHVFLDWTGGGIPTAPCGNSKCYQNLDQA